MDEKAINTIKQLIGIIKQAIDEGYDVPMKQFNRYLEAKILIQSVMEKRKMNEIRTYGVHIDEKEVDLPSMEDLTMD